MMSSYIIDWQCHLCGIKDSRNKFSAKSYKYTIIDINNSYFGIDSLYIMQISAIHCSYTINNPFYYSSYADIICVHIFIFNKYLIKGKMIVFVWTTRKKKLNMVLRAFELSCRCLYLNFICYKSVKITNLENLMPCYATFNNYWIHAKANKDEKYNGVPSVLNLSRWQVMCGLLSRDLKVNIWVNWLQPMPHFAA